MTSSRTDGAPSQEGGEATVRSSATLKRIADLFTLALSLIIILSLLWLLSDVILVLFAATLMACQLVGASRFVSRWTKLPYGLSLTAVILTLVIVVGLFAWLRGPDLAYQGKVIYGQVNDQIGSLWTRLGNIDALQGAIEKAQAYFSHIGSHLAGYAAGFVTSTLGGFGTVLLIVVAGIYLAVAPETYTGGLVALMPHAWRSHGSRVLEREGHTLRWWFIGQLADMVAIGILTFIGLYCLGVKLSFALALIAALCNFVPYIGALAGSVPAILVALSDSPRTALYVAILFVVVQTLEGNLISPLIQKRTVALPPIVTLLSQTVLGTLFGPMGLILATPITAGALVLVRMVYQQKILGDEPMNPMEA